MRIQPSEYLALDLRVHSLLADVPLHDVWRVDLEDGGPDRTVLDTPGALQVRVQVAEREAVRERQLLNHLLLNYQGAPTPRRAALPPATRAGPIDTEER